MALYKLSEDTGEAIQCDFGDYKDWHSGIKSDDLIIAKHVIVEINVKNKKVILPVDALKHPHHSGKVLETVVTRLRTNTEGNPPWETGVECDAPAFFSQTRAQAMEAHKLMVNRKTKDRGGRGTLIR
jgi:uncharacterized protein YifN (PemK superfamily)